MFFKAVRLLGVGFGELEKRFTKFEHEFDDNEKDIEI